MLNSANLAQEVAKMAKKLPAFPTIVIQLLDMLRDESASLEVLARMARNDPIISANILAQANHVRRIHAQSDLTDSFVAASIIGVNRVRRIVVSTGMNRFVSSVPGGLFLFQHSLAVAIAAEAGELLQHFVWQTPQQSAQRATERRAEISGEVADVAILLFELADNLGLDLAAVMRAKLAKNEERYPVAKARGSNKKYNEL